MGHVAGVAAEFPGFAWIAEKIRAAMGASAAMFFT